MKIFIQENAFEHVVCKMAAILSWPQCVNHDQQKFAVDWLDMTIVTLNFSEKISKYIYICYFFSTIFVLDLCSCVKSPYCNPDKACNPLLLMFTPAVTIPVTSARYHSHNYRAIRGDLATSTCHRFIMMKYQVSHFLYEWPFVGRIHNWGAFCARGSISSKFDSGIGNSAAKTHVKFQSNWAT